MMLLLPVAAEQSKFCLWTMLPDALLTNILDLFSTLSHYGFRFLYNYSVNTP